MVSSDHIWSILAEVSDPEIPVLNVVEMGIVREVLISDTGVEVTITPTYSGCPAMEQIHDDILLTLKRLGISGHVSTQLAPAWTTDWMTEKGKEKLEAYGIAPPKRKSSNPLALFEEDTVTCPKCKSDDTVLTSQFGATSCKALYKCNHCKEPFEHFKCH